MVKQNPVIKISKETKAELDKLGSKTDTYDDIILKMIKVVKKLKRKLR